MKKSDQSHSKIVSHHHQTLEKESENITHTVELTHSAESRSSHYKAFFVTKQSVLVNVDWQRSPVKGSGRTSKKPEGEE